MAAVCCAYVRKVHCAVVHSLFQTRRHLAVVTKIVTMCAQREFRQQYRALHYTLHGNKIVLQVKGHGQTPTFIQLKNAAGYITM